MDFFADFKALCRTYLTQVDQEDAEKGAKSKALKFKDRFIADDWT